MKRHLAIIWALLLCCNWHLLAQRPQIRLDHVFPMSAAAGTDTTVAISGELSEAATGLVFSDPGIEATQKIMPATEYTVAHRQPRTFDVRVGPEVADGRYEVRAIGPIGLSAPRTFCVSRLTERTFNASGNSRNSPFEISVGQAVNARGRNDQRDFYRFSAKQDQSLLIQVWADRIDSSFDGELAVYGPTGERLARVRQSRTNDPILCLVPPTDGEYVVEVWEATFRGGNDNFYRLEVSERSQVEAIHPAVAQEDVESDFTVYGYNLPGGQSISGSSGNLQSREIRFAPAFGDASFSHALAAGHASAARVDGGSVALPIPLSTSHVFMSRATNDVVHETSNDEPANAQAIRIPVDIAGQFYPRRDVDWFQFEAKQGQKIRIDLYSQQLGTHADPILRVGKLQEGDDGKTKFESVAVSDDIEASPNNRAQRRFFTGTVDSSHRFIAPQDGTYAISISDQYNTSADDPSLVYWLSVAEETPDFSLVAYAEPERHNDDKIIKPNGISIAPGGRGLVRVRLLPRHGFQDSVSISVFDLPAGVVAEPLTLSKQSPEGILILSAAQEIPTGASAIRVVGTSQVNGVTVQRGARSGMICTSTNNVDQTPASVRLCDSLTVAVVEAGDDPVRFDPLMKLVTSVGANPKLPVSLTRNDRYKDKELQIAGSSLPSGVKINAAKTKGQQIDVQTEIGKVAAGTYTFSLTSKVKDRRPRNIVALREAEADFEKTTKLLADREASVLLQTAVSERLLKLSAKTEEALQQAERQVDEPRRLLESNLTELQALAKQLADQLQDSAADISNETLSNAVDETQHKIAQLRAQTKSLQANLASVSQPLENLRLLRTQQLSEQELLTTTLASLRKKRDEAKAKQDEFTKRVAELKKNELEKEAEFYVYSPSLQVEIASSPITLKSQSDPIKIKRGSTAQIPVAIQRNFGFRGPVRIDFIGVTGLTSASTVIGPGQRSARLSVTADNDATLGKTYINFESKLNFNNIDIQDRLAIPIEVTE